MKAIRADSAHGSATIEAGDDHYVVTVDEHEAGGPQKMELQRDSVENLRFVLNVFLGREACR